MKMLNEIKALGLKAISLMTCACLVLALSACVSDNRRVFNVEPSDEQALLDYLQLSMGYLAEQDLVNARRHLNNAMAIDSNNSTAYGIWGLLYSSEGDLELADDSFRKSLRLESSNSQVRNNYAAFLFSNARYEEAYSQLERVVEDTNYPARAQAFENMGVAAKQLKNVEGAEYAFRRALQLNPNQLQANLEMAELNIDQGNYAQAKSFYSTFLTLIQFYDVEQSARSLWAGVEIELGLSNNDGANNYGALLESKYAQSVEYGFYQQVKNN